MSDESNSRYAVVTTACADAGEAEKIAAVLLERKLAACIQTSPVVSRYIWKGEICTDKEVLLFIKCRRDCYAGIEQAILENHSYELPEILVIPVFGGYGKYLKWIDGED
jgi:periplasmic divalent cation tolerance protein